MLRIPWIVIIAVTVGYISTTTVVQAQDIPLSSEERSTVSTVHEVLIPKALDKFVPAMLNIRVGDTVKWVNEDDRAHPIASIPGQGTNDKELFSAPIAPGKSWSHTFKQAGEYPYFCYIHYVMMGAVIVEEGEEEQSK